MKHSLIKQLILSSALIVVVHSASAATVTTWNFNNLATGTNLTPAVSTGAGSASTLGMTNSYLGNSVDSSDILIGANASNEWRVRGTNGWNTSAPQYTQGVQFLSSTVGFSNLVFSYDWYSTNAGVRDLQAQYTIDGSTWTNVGSLQVASSNAYRTGLSIDFGALGITSVNNDATFGVRLVSAYDPTYTASNTYTMASSTNSTQTVINNTSGNWRFDNIAISGTVAAIPEPESYAMLLAGFGMVGFMARRRKQTA